VRKNCICDKTVLLAVNYFLLINFFYIFPALDALTLLVGHQEEYAACKN